jgi:hypothetical protein
MELKNSGNNWVLGIPAISHLVTEMGSSANEPKKSVFLKTPVSSPS